MKRLAHDLLKCYVRYFPMSKGKHRMVSYLWKPLSFGDYKHIATLRQAKVKMNCDITQLVQRNLYFWGGCEEEYWMRFARDCQVIFDVGANVGLYSLLASAVNPQSNIHAFEPTPEMADIFKDNIKLRL